jgi:ABC-type uncharacterized transport system ATPase subunit
VIEVNHLSKYYMIAQPEKVLGGKINGPFLPQYKTIKAVNDISNTVQKGEIIGYLGPNGAGKSNTIKLLTCVFVPIPRKPAIRIKRRPHGYGAFLLSCRGWTRLSHRGKSATSRL